MEQKPDSRSWWEKAPGLHLRGQMHTHGYERLKFRPIEPEDEARMVVFHRGLSEETIFSRYFEHMTLERRTQHERLMQICTNTDESFALVVLNGSKILAVARISRTDDPAAADFALLVQDKAQGHGIGLLLLEKVLEIARAKEFERLTGEVLVANHNMQHICREYGFDLHTEAEDGVVRVTLQLRKEK